MKTNPWQNVELELEQHWDYSQPEQSEQRFRVLLADFPAARAEILTQIARAQGLQQKFDEAHQTLDEVQQLPQDSHIQIRYLLERGRVFRSAKQQELARPLFLEAYYLAKTQGADFYAIDAAHMMAIIETSEHQLEWHEICLQLCEQSSQERAKKWMGSISNNVAWTYHDLGQFERALQIFQQALEWQEANGNPQARRIAKWSVARTLRSLGRFEEAISIQLALLQEEPNDGYIDEEFGECLLALGKLEQAKPHFAKAYQLLSQDDWFVQNEQNRLERLRTLGHNVT